MIKIGTKNLIIKITEIKIFWKSWEELKLLIIKVMRVGTKTKVMK